MAGEPADLSKELADAKKLPFSERFTHKLWNARVEAYNEIAESCNAAHNISEPALREFGSLAAKVVTDANPNAQGKAFEALEKFLTNIADEDYVSKYGGAICAAFAAKGLNGKPTTVKMLTECCQQMIELEGAEVVVECLIKAFSNKVPKVVVAALDTLLAAVGNFGTKVVSCKPILKALPPLFENRDKNVRSKTKDLTVLLVQWVGANIVRPALVEKMNKTAQKEVEDMIAAVATEGKALATRYTRKEQAARKAAEAAGQAADVDEGAAEAKPAQAAAEVEEGQDPFDFFDPVDIFPELNKPSLSIEDSSDKLSFWNAMKSDKWKFQKAALQSLVALAEDKKRFSPNGDYREIGSILKKAMTHSNAAIVADAIAVVGAFGKVLRADWKTFSVTLVPVMLEKLKDKNLMITKSTQATLNALSSHCLSLGDVVDDIAGALGHKVPKVKVEICVWLKAAILVAGKAVLASIAKVLMPALLKTINDTVPEVRNAAIEAVAVYASVLGGIGHIPKAQLDKLDARWKKRLEEQVIALSSAGGSEAPSQAAPAPPKSLAKAPASPVRKSTTALKDQSNSQARPSADKPAAKAATRAASSKTKAAKDDSEDNLDTGGMTPEEIETKIIELAGEGLLGQLKSSNWKERLEAMNNLLAVTEQMKENVGTHSELLIRQMALFPGWKENNLQVMTKMFELFENICSKSTSFSKKEAHLAMPGLVEKVGELKLKPRVFSCLSTFSEAVGPMFIFKEVNKKITGHKNPKVVTEAVNWLAVALEEFGASSVDVKVVVGWMKETIGENNPKVREAAIKVLVLLHEAIGAPVQALLADVKPALLNTIQAEFAKKPHNPGAAAPTRTVRGQEKATSGGGMSKTDISGKITPKLVQDMSASDWKTRAQALETVDGLLKEAGGSISSDVGELVSILKGRLSDSNKNLVMTAMKCLASVAVAMGPPMDKHCKVVMPDVLKNLGDNKKMVRDACLQSLEEWCNAISTEKVLPHVLAALALPKLSSEGKHDGMVWLAGKPLESADLNAMIKLAAGYAGDKISDVREAASHLIEALVKGRGGDAVAAAAKADKALAPILDKLGVGSSGTSMAAPTASAGGPTKTLKSKTGIPSVRQSTAIPSSRPSTARKDAAVRASVPTGFATARSSGGDEPAGPMIVLMDGKEERTKSFSAPRKHKYEDLRPEFAEETEQQLAPLLRMDIRALMFDKKDFRKHVLAAEKLQAGLDTDESLLDAAAGTLDLLLRWSALRMCEGNTSSLLKTLELLQVLFERLGGTGYRLTEHEAVVFLPIMFEKSGHNIVQIREKFRQLFKAVAGVYPVSKVLVYMEAALLSKNNRTKVEVLEAIAGIVEEKGLDGSKAHKVLPAIVTIVQKGDATSRGTALNTLATIYQVEGEEVWKSLGKMPDNTKDAIGDKFKWKLKQMKTKGQGQPGDARAKFAEQALASASTTPGPSVPVSRIASPEGRRSAEPDAPPSVPHSSTPSRIPRPPVSDSSSFDLEAPAESAAPAPERSRSPALPAPMPSLSPKRPSIPASNRDAPSASAFSLAVPVPHEPAMDQSMALDTLERPPFDLDDVLGAIHSPDNEVSVQGMKIFCSYLNESSQNGAEPKMFVANADRIVGLLVAKCRELFGIVLAYSPGLDPDLVQARLSSRSCKYILNTLMLTFTVPDVAMVISQPVLEKMVCQLLICLLNPKVGTIVPNSDDGANLTKALNLLMLKVLDRAEINAAYMSLLHLLLPNEEVLRQVHEVCATCDFEYLVVKCLIKLTKALQGGQKQIGQLDLDVLLKTISDMFDKLGIDEIRRRGQEDDRPLRMVKTVLRELCKIKGDEIKKHLTLIPVPQEGRDSMIIVSYIDLNLNTIREEQKQASRSPATPVSMRSSMRSDQVLAMRAEAASDSPAPDMKQELAAIFKKIGDKEHTTVGLEELFRFTQKHPETDIAPHLSKTSEAFRVYIKKGLEKVEQSIRTGTAPSPMQSPLPQKPRMTPSMLNPDKQQAATDELLSRMMARKQESSENTTSEVSNENVNSVNNEALNEAPGTPPAPTHELRANRSDSIGSSDRQLRIRGEVPTTRSQDIPATRKSITTLEVLRERIESIKQASTTAGSAPATTSANQAPAVTETTIAPTPGLVASISPSSSFTTSSSMKGGNVSMQDLKERMAKLQEASDNVTRKPEDKS